MERCDLCGGELFIHGDCVTCTPLLVPLMVPLYRAQQDAPLLLPRVSAPEPVAAPRREVYVRASEYVELAG